MNCSDCDELTQYEYQCDKNNIFDFKEECSILLYYSYPIKFSGCPFANYLLTESVMNFIRLKTISENVDFESMNFIQSECVQAFIEDRNVQSLGELKQAREKKGV